MKIFISWSGKRSKEVAELLSDWVKCVLQASKPWISTRDIDKGAIWFSEISDQLKDTAAGIVCLTQENKDKPWILFETGALAKGLSTSRVCTFLIDLTPSDIEDPLAQFNHTMPEESSLWGLICSLNNCLGAERLDERILKQVFMTYWPQFERSFADIIDKTPTESKPKARSEKSLLGEILENTRALSTRIRELEKTAHSQLSIPPIPPSAFVPAPPPPPPTSKNIPAFDLFNTAMGLLSTGSTSDQVIEQLSVYHGCSLAKAEKITLQALADLKRRNPGTQ